MKYPINSIPKVNPPTQVILTSDFGETFNERNLESAYESTFACDVLSNMNTKSKQGMSQHNLNRENIGESEMPWNRPQTNGTTYPNTTNISAYNTNIKQQGASHGKE